MKIVKMTNSEEINVERRLGDLLRESEGVIAEKYISYARKYYSYIKKTAKNNRETLRLLREGLYYLNDGLETCAMAGMFSSSTTLDKCRDIYNRISDQGFSIGEAVRIYEIEIARLQKLDSRSRENGTN